MPNRFSEGVEFFNAGRFFDAHEAWEDAWRESSEPERRWLQGMVQSAVALHHYSTGNRTGALSVLERAIRNLDDGPAMLRGVDVRLFRQDLMRVRAEIAAENPLTPVMISVKG